METSKKVAAVAVILIAIVLAAIVVNYYYVQPTTLNAKFTTGLSAKFKVNDAGASILLTDTEATVSFYNVGVNPIGTKVFSTPALETATYDSVNGFWVAQLNAGSYVALVVDKNTTKTFYAGTFSILVPGTNADSKEVWINSPSTLTVYSRQTTTPEARTIKAVADENGLAITPATVTTINTTAYSAWRITYTLDAVAPANGAANAILPDSIIYLPASITGLSVSSATQDGSAVAVTQNLDATTGPIGYQIAISGMSVTGKPQTIVVVDIQASGVIAGGSLQAKLFEDSTLLRTSLRWWGADAAVSSAITVEQ